MDGGRWSCAMRFGGGYVPADLQTPSQTPCHLLCAQIQQVLHRLVASPGDPDPQPPGHPLSLPPCPKTPKLPPAPQPAWTAPGSSCPIFGRVFGCGMLCSRLAPAASCSPGGSCFLGDPGGSLCPHPGDVSTLLCPPSLWWGAVGCSPRTPPPAPRSLPLVKRQDVYMRVSGW